MTSEYKVCMTCCTVFYDFHLRIFDSGMLTAYLHEFEIDKAQLNQIRRIHILFEVSASTCNSHYCFL